MNKSTRRQHVDVDLQELDRIIDGAMQAPLSESDGRKLKTAVHAMAEKLARQRSTEKTRSVLEGAQSPAAPQKPPVGSGKSSPAGRAQRRRGESRSAEGPGSTRVPEGGRPVSGRAVRRQGISAA